MKRTDLRDFIEDSYIGLAEFRRLFRLPKLEQMPNFNIFKINKSSKNPTEIQRKQMAEFTLDAFQGDYMAIWMFEIKRIFIGDPLSYEFV